MLYKRQHPIKILGYTTRNFWLLSIPLIRGLFYLQFNFQAWLEGAWFDILIVFLMLAFAILRWLTLVYKFDETSFYLKKGIYNRAESEIFYFKFTSVEIEKKFLLAPFKAAIINIDTNAGSKKKSDLILTLKQSDINNFSEIYTNSTSSTNLKYIYTPRKWHLVFFSLVFSNTLSGVILISTLFYQGGKIVGNELERTFVDTFSSYSRKIARGLSPTALAIALIILGGWLLSFCINLLRHWNFSSERKGSNIVVKNGFFTKRVNYLNTTKINYVDFRQSLTTIIFKISSVHIHCSGYGKSKNAIAVLVPITIKKEVFNTLHMLLPKYPVARVTVKPTRFQIRRYIFSPILFILFIPLIALALILIFPSWNSMILFVSVIFLIPLVWLLIVKIISDFTTGIGYADGFMILKYCKLYEYHTVIVPVEKISMVEIKQSFAQKPTDNCNLVIYTNAERTKYHFIKYLTYSETLAFLEKNKINYLK